MTRAVEMRSEIDTAENGALTIDQGGNQVTLRWTEDFDARGRLCRSFTVSAVEFDAIAAEVARFRHVQQIVNEAPANAIEATVMNRRVS